MNFVKANLINIILAAVASAMSLFVGILEARMLGPTEMGRFQVLISTRTLILTLFALGLGNASIYFINQKHEPLSEIVCTTFKAEAILGIVLGIFLTLIICLFPSYFGAIPLVVVLIFSFGSAALMFTTTLSPLLVADMRVVQRQLVNMTVSIFTLIPLLYYFFISKELDVNKIIIIVSISGFFAALLLIKYLAKDFYFKSKFDFALCKSLTIFGVKMSANNIAFLFLENVPVYMLSWFSALKFEDVGLYSRAIAICTLGTFLNVTVGPLLYAKFSGISDLEKIEKSQIASTCFFVMNLFVVLVILLFGKDIIYLLYGIEYIGAASALSVLAFTLILNGINELVYNLLSSLGKPEYLLYNLLVTLVVLIPTLYLGISLYGLFGCACVVLIATVIKTLLLIRSLRIFIPINYTNFFIVTPKRLKEVINLIKQIR